MSRRITGLPLFALVALAAAAAAAQTSAPQRDKKPFELTADSVEYESARHIYVARGNVRIVSGKSELTADWMALNEVQNRGVATGNVVYRSQGDELHANFIEFDVDSGRGILFAARFEPEESDFRLEGDQIIRHDDDTYSFEEGMFTTCVCPPGESDPWQIRAESADIKRGGYATARNTTFEILGVPVIWLPWMVYPVKSERESGFLFPKLGYSKRNGFELGLPFFWAARDDLNVTLTPYWLSKRGAKLDGDVEYVYGEHSEGEVHAAFVHDVDIDPYSEDDPFGRERWALHGEQDARLPFGVRAKSSFQVISDNEYLEDFNDMPAQKDDRFLESVAFAGRSLGDSGRFRAQVAAFYAEDLQNPTDQDRDKVMLQRLPTLNAAALPAPVVESVPVLDRLVPALDFEYNLFVPRRRATDKYDSLPNAYYVGNQFIDSGIDGIPTPNERGFPGNPDPDGDDATAGGTGPELNGSFQEGELLADDGHRLDIFPRLGVPFRVGDYVEAYPEIGWHETYYDSHFAGSDERHLLTTRVDLRSRLVRRYGNDIVHLLEPRLGYAFVSDLGQDQDANPLFVPKTAVPQERIRQLDLENVTHDYADRVSGFNGLSVGVGNRIYRTGDAEAGPTLLADFYLSSLFRLDDDGFGNIFLGARAYPWERTFAWVDLGFDPAKTRISEIILQLDHKTREGHAVRLGYRYLHDTPRFYEDFGAKRFDDFTEEFNHINQVRLATRYVVTPQWSLFHRIAYSFEDSLLLRTSGGIEYLSKCRCWAAGVEAGYSRSRGFQFNLMYRLLGLGEEFEGIGIGGGLLDGV